MKYNTTDIKSIGELLEYLNKHKDSNAPLWFRGQSNSNWNL